MRGHISLGTKAAMTRQSLDLLRQRYVIEKKPLEASVERILRADTRAGAPRPELDGTVVRVPSQAVRGTP